MTQQWQWPEYQHFHWFTKSHFLQDDTQWARRHAEGCKNSELKELKALITGRKPADLCLGRDVIFIILGSKQACPLLQRRPLFLFSKVDSFTHILEKITWFYWLSKISLNENQSSFSSSVSFIECANMLFSL